MHDLLPQHRGDLIAVEPVKDSAGFLGIDEVAIELASLVHRTSDRFFGDLVEHHALGWDLRLEDLKQVPGDCLTLAVLICGEQEFVGGFELLLQLGNFGLLACVDHIDRGEVVVDVDRHPRPRQAFVLCRDVGRVWKITNMANAGVNLVPRSEVPLDGLCLSRGLHDHEPA